MNTNSSKALTERPSLLVSSILAGCGAGLTCLGMIELGTGSALSIGLGIVGFSAILVFVASVGRARARERAARLADADGRPLDGRG